MRSFLAPFAVTMPVALFILDMQFLWVYADDLIGKRTGTLGHRRADDLRLSTAGEPAPFRLAILVASIMAFGSLAERNELTALKSAGLSVFRIFRPLIVTMLLISMGAFWFSNAAWPVANLKFRALLFSVTQKKPTLNLIPGAFYNGIEGFAIRVESKEEDGTLNDVLIHDHREGETGVSHVLFEPSKAPWCKMETGSPSPCPMASAMKKTWSNPNGERSASTPTSPLPSNGRNLRLTSPRWISARPTKRLFKRAHEMMTVAQLGHAMDSLQGLVDQRLEEVELYGGRQTVLLRDTVSAVGTVQAAGPLWTAMSPTERRMAFDGARSLARNTRQGIANGIENAIRGFGR